MIRSRFLRNMAVAALVGFIDIKALVQEVVTMGSLVVDGGMESTKDVYIDGHYQVTFNLTEEDLRDAWCHLEGLAR